MGDRAQGESDLARGRLRPKLPALREALEGHFRTAHHGLIIAQMLAHVDALDEFVATLSAQVEEVIAPFSRQVELLCTIPGVQQRTAEAIIAEIGIDMTRFPTSESQGRYRTVAGNLRVKEVVVDDGTARDRFVVCHNPEAAERDATIRGQLVAHLAGIIDGSDTLVPTARAELRG